MTEKDPLALIISAALTSHRETVAALIATHHVAMDALTALAAGIAPLDVDTPIPYELTGRTPADDWNLWQLLADSPAAAAALAQLGPNERLNMLLKALGRQPPPNAELRNPNTGKVEHLHINPADPEAFGAALDALYKDWYNQPPDAAADQPDA